MRDGEDGHARAAGGRVEQRTDIERVAFEPGFEAGGGEQVIERNCELEAFFRRVEGFDFEHADASDRRLLDLLDEGGQIQVIALHPGAFDELTDEDVLAGLDGVRDDVHEREQGGGGGLNPLAHGFAVFAHLFRRRAEGAEDADRVAGRGAGGVDGVVGRIAQALDAGAVLSPIGEALLPAFGDFGGELVFSDAFFAGFLFVDPGGEISRVEGGEVEQQVRKIAFRVDDDGGDAIDGGFFEQTDAEAGLAAAGHTDADGVGDQVLGIEKEEAIVFFAEIEYAELFEILHRL